MKTVRMYDGKVFGHEVSDYAKFKTYHMDEVYIEQNEDALSFTSQKILGY